MIELLAPAGDEKCFFAAVNNGADAVYLGLSDFSARKNAQNFTCDNISYYVSYAHALGVKVYVAVNTLVKDCEMQKFLQTVSAGYSANADAFILQDVSLAKILKKEFPDIRLHLSTQAGINEIGGAKFAKAEGFSRVILARETPLCEIKKITEIIETETFAHGALCTCFSGHCYMSAYVGGNSGNRGLCKQPCRKEYKLEGKNGGKYPISLSDLNLSDEIQTLILSGVKSIKIEGRMRSPEYVASAVRLYRNAIDGRPFNLSEVKRSFNRGNYTKGYLYGVDENIISDKIQNHSGEKIGVVKSIKGDTLTVSPRRKNIKGDAFKIISNGIEVGNAFSPDGEDYLKFKGKVKIGDSVHITKDQSLSETLFEKNKKRNIEVYCKAVEGEKLYLSAEGVEVYSDGAVESALKSPTTKDEIVSNLLKTDVYPFEVTPTVETSSRPFIPKSTLNRLRAKLYNDVFTKDVKPLKNSFIIEENENNYVLNYDDVILSDIAIEVPNGCAFVFRPKDYSDFDFIKSELTKVKGDAYLFIPSFLPQNCAKEIERILPLFSGVYADGISGISLSEEHGKKLILGLGLNAFNKVDVKRLKELTDDLVLSQELSISEIADFADKSGYVFTSGSIRLMELLYCPFGKKCSSCNRENGEYILTDEMGRKFKVVKYKIGGSCRFEIYNEQILYWQKQKHNLYNFIGLSEEIAKKLYCGSKEDIKATLLTTVGNLKRGVL